MRTSVFEEEFRDDLIWWVKTGRKVALRILKLVEDVLRNPYEGIGRPEQLRYLGPGTWSRRITQEHRMVYVVKDDRVDFVSCRYHY